ncbi:hypothetical protein D9758_003230 [Tetrapyrgos nigripes]|uniref:Kynurenine 3-monooxygenase n=1 Tax=Tetrapyrgos nigripes TaxID=182062 RepID=A0A8H5GIL1_9AGAR|nr:hypothetical protein D9758_003230 [Tetrapyrgos nigripes]
MSHRRKAVVVGAGPVGCLAAIMLSNHGWKVELYEGRPDIRLPSSKAASQQRSINLAISHRGIAAIQSVDPNAAQRFMQSVIPMRGRMIHHVDGRLDSQIYDRDGQCINSIDRTLLNEDLLQEASSSPNIRVFFEHKVQGVDFDKRVMNIRDVSQSCELDVSFDLIIGADGSYSTVRRQMMRVLRMDYQQEYIRHEYIELRMPADRDKEGRLSFALDANHLHIWPRKSFMLIALPNQDYTFTCTLFAPSSELDRLDSPDKFVNWFGTYFQDALLAIGEQNLIKDFTHNPRSPLICTRSNPYHYKDRGIVLGDAAHSMVPFYGQGLNCGLEDVRILNVLLKQEQVSPTKTGNEADDLRLSRALSRYSQERHKDLIAIADLAMANYVEMRHLVTTPLYIIRKAFDNVLYSLTRGCTTSLAEHCGTLSGVEYAEGEPRGWVPLYTMVTFRPDVSYDTVRRTAEWQKRIVEAVGVTTLMCVAGVIWGLRRSKMI